MSEAKVQERDAEEMVERLNALVEQLEGHPDADAREKALDLVQIILELHGEVLRRILSTLDTLPDKDQVLTRITGDEVIRAILLIHGLLPVELHTRVASAIKELRTHLISQGCDVELLDVNDGRARLRMIRSGKSAPPVAALKMEIEKALSEAAPDLLGFDIEGVTEQTKATVKAAALLEAMIAPARNSEPKQIKLVQIKRPRHDTKTVNGTWIPVVRALNFEDNHFTVITFAEINVLVCKIGGEFYDYRNACVAEGKRPLDDALFDSPMLTCTCHGYSYNLRRGACVERPELHLEPLALKIEDDKVMVAL